MALKVTMKLAGQDVVLEGNSIEVVAVLKGLQDDARPTRKAEPPLDLLTPRDEPTLDERDQGGRNPRGLNRKLALQALAAAGANGILQAHAKQWIARNKKHDLAVSSVRHALNQLQEKGLAMRTGDTWRISGNGVHALAAMEAEDRRLEGASA